MKFGKWLKRQIEQSLPEWQEQFLCYKELKRCINAVAGGLLPTPEEEARFIGRLDTEVDKVNAFFLDQEEFIICHRQLQEEIMRVVARKAAGVPPAWWRARRRACRWRGTRPRPPPCAGRSSISMVRWCCSSTTAASTT
jgi:hypothetical protein